MYKIGEILNTHGIKGEVKIRQITDFNERFDSGKLVYLEEETGEKELTVADSRFHKQMLLVQFVGYHSINEAEALKGKSLYIKESQQKPLGEHEYYYHEIIGCQTVTTEGETLGIIDAILEPGANDVWVVKMETGREVLIPYIADVVKEVDIANKLVTIELMEGLID